ncbi:hypothetical protein ACMDCR_29590 [Labrys okinawensis]|uniref:hypothetical protein n=1 Tax=Labrys okinawensis TaxID=346911 RepID=UPI0039BD4C7A
MGSGVMVMPQVTRYLVLPFTRDHRGELLGLEPEEVPDAARANFRAFNMVGRARRVAKVVGTIAFSHSGDLAAGVLGDPVILARYGETPDDAVGIK